MRAPHPNAISFAETDYINGAREAYEVPAASIEADLDRCKRIAAAITEAADGLIDMLDGLEFAAPRGEPYGRFEIIDLIADAVASRANGEAARLIGAHLLTAQMAAEAQVHMARAA